MEKLLLSLAFCHFICRPIFIVCEGASSEESDFSKITIPNYYENFQKFSNGDEFVSFFDSHIPPLKTIDTIVKPRKLLVDDGVNEDDVLQELPERTKSIITEGDGSALMWRLKDLSILEELADDILSAEGYSHIEEDGSEFSSILDQNDDPSQIYEVRVDPPLTSETEMCLKASGECNSNITTKSLREKLLRDLEESNSEPLTSRIEYRLKRQPSIYKSKRPQTRSDIGIPDIYEMEVEVTPVHRLTTLSQKSREQQLSLQENKRKRFKSFASSPKFVSLGSLNSFKKGTDDREHDSNSSKRKRLKNGSRNRLLSRGSAILQSNPRAGGIKRHLPYRRPLSFKFKRSGANSKGDFWLEHSRKQTKELSPLEKITRNKTPGIVIDQNGNKIVFPYKQGGSNRLKRPLSIVLTQRYQNNRKRHKIRPAVLRYKNRRERPAVTNSEEYLPPDEEKTPITYQVPSLLYETPTNEYLPPDKEQTPNTHQVPSVRYETPINEYLPPNKEQAPNTYQVPSVRYEIPTNEYLPPDKERTPNTYRVPSSRYETPTNEYLPPDKENTPNTYQVPSSRYETPTNEYLPPDKEQIPDKYRVPSSRYETPTNEYLPPNDEQTQTNYQVPSKLYETPTNEYLPPDKEINTYQVPSKLYETPTNEYLPPAKQDYDVPSQRYETPSNEYLPPNKQSSQSNKDIPRRSKGQIPGWLMKINPTPPPSYFSEPTTPWTPLSPNDNIGPTFIMPKEKYSSPHSMGHTKIQQGYGLSPDDIRALTKHKQSNTRGNQPNIPLRTYQLPQYEYLPPNKNSNIQTSSKGDPTSLYKVPSLTYDLPTKSYTPPEAGTPIKEYLPPDTDLPVAVQNSHGRRQPPLPTIYEPLDASVLPPNEGYTPQISYETLDPKHLEIITHVSTKQNYIPPSSASSIRNDNSSYSPPVYVPTLSKPSIKDLVPTRKPSKLHPQIIIIDDDYDDEYYDDYGDDYYDNAGYFDNNNYDDFQNHNRPFMPHVLMADLDTAIHEMDLMEYGYIIGIPGIAGRDYPILQYIPLTTFRCHLVADYPGYYADMAAGCQVFHVCHRSGRQDSFLCPNGTIFNQKYFVCDWWYNFSCEDAAFFYPVNAAIDFQEVSYEEQTVQPSKGQYSQHSSEGLRSRRKTSKTITGGRRKYRETRRRRRGELRIKQTS